MSALVAPVGSDTGAGAGAEPPPPSGDTARAAAELCPLCNAPLKPEQSWCLRCGAAARTRLAAQPKWKWLVVTMVTVVVLSLAVLAAALVKLAG